MERKKTIFDFVAEFLIIFAVTMLFMMFFTLTVGESAKEMSKMYPLGGRGIGLEVMAQFLMLSFLVTGMKYICDSEFMQKRMPEFFRVVLMMASIIAAVAVFAVIFEWFPLDMWQPWAWFLVCFGICAVLSYCIVAMKVKIENKKMEEGLERMKRQWEEEGNDEE